MSNEIPLLTIAIPTWNRSEYLRMNLAQLKAEIAGKSHLVEIMVSDNCSADDTKAVVSDYIEQGMAIRYIRNAVNIGSDHNIAQCFNEASGRYVLILGDDDLLVDGALDRLLKVLAADTYGVVFIRPYGYDENFKAEKPQFKSASKEFDNPCQFLAHIGALAGLISSNVINKQVLQGENADKYCGSNLVQTYLIYDAALKAGRNYLFNEYLVAYKRNNWGYYPFTKVFVEKFWGVVDYFSERGLDRKSIRKLKRNMLVGYYPFYVFKMRLGNTENLQADYQLFKARFGDTGWFWLTIAPQYRLPRMLALIWGGVVVTIGRSLMGDALRGLSFIRSLVMQKLWRLPK